MGLILVDVDEFKGVNDTKGHDAGDEALKMVAKLLNGLALENRYCIARIGGDEFALILQGTKKDCFPAIEKEIERMNQVLGTGEGAVPKLSVSVGVAFSENGYSKDLFRQADQALYETKKQGGGSCHMYQGA